MLVTHNLLIDLVKRGPQPVVAAVQGEANTRQLAISLFSNSNAWTVPAGATAAVAFLKPDGTRGLYDKLPDGSPATSISGSTVTAILAPQALTCAGTVLASVVFYDADMDTLATFPFKIIVEENPAAGEQISNDYYNPSIHDLDAAIKELEERVAGLEQNGGGGTGGGSGEPGADGFSPIATVTQTDEGAVISITDKNGTTTATVANGKDGAKGDKGDKGDTGETGPAGPQGEKGEKGDTGAQGPKGDTGATGSQGPKGDKGDTGATGPGGADGTSVTVKAVAESTADGGINMVTFSDGKTLTIKNGSKGDKGDTGETGPAGADGAKGEKGDKGDTGATGSQGPKGDTGATGPAGANGKDGKTPVKGTDYFTEADKAEMVEEVQNAMDGIPSYWMTHLTAKIPSINTAMEAAGRNKSAFYFYTDAHRISSANTTPAILRYLYRHTSINKTNNGGDFFEPFATGADNLATMRNYMADMRGVSNHHSVIGNHDEDNEALTSDKQMYGFYFAWEESNDVVWGGYHYYYIDNKSENTRYIYLDTGKFAVSNAEMQFVIDALTSTPEGWHIIPISHIWYDYEISALPDYVLNLLAVFDAYNVRGTGSVTHNGTAVAYDFKGSLGTVEFCIGGHVHADQVHYSTGGIPIIITDTDSLTRKGSAATLGTITEGCIDAVIADYDARTLKLIRLGRGSDRTITIPSYKPVEIVNILGTADIQYNKRYSPTSESFKDDLGTISFLIPWADVFGKTIYFKGFSNITSKGGQVSAWRGVKGTNNQPFIGATNYNIFASPNLQQSNGVYSITVNASTISATADSFDSLQVQFVLNTTGASVSVADLANCIMTIDQPIE